MNYADTLIELDLHELLGGSKPPDLIEQTLARLALPDTFDDEGAAHAQPAPRGRLITPWRLLQAASVLLAIGWMAWLLVRPDALPEGVTASDGASWRVRADHVEISDGWYLLASSAPELRAGGVRVSDVDGRAVAGIGIPGEEMLDLLADQLELSAMEKEMFIDMKRWLTAGSLALCLFTGSATFNGERVTAQQHEPGEDQKPDVKPDPKPDVPSGTGFRVLREWTGADSSMTRPSVEFVTDIDRWETLWSQHRVVPENSRAIPVPAVDFENEIVLAVFRGKSTNSRGYQVVEILQGALEYIVRIEESTYQTTGPDGGGVDVTPYGLFVLPRVDRFVALEVNVQYSKNRSNLWSRRQARYEPVVSPRYGMFEWTPAQAYSGEGASGTFRGVHMARTEQEWSSLQQRLGVALDAMIPPDFSKQVVVAAANDTFTGMGGMILSGAYRDSRRVILRVSTPITRPADMLQPTVAWGVWVLAKIRGDLDIEDSLTGGNEPGQWSLAVHLGKIDGALAISETASGSIATGPSKSAYRLIRTADDWATYCKEQEIENAAKWADFESEMVVVIRLNGQRIYPVMAFFLLEETEQITLTYQISGPSGVDPGTNFLWGHVKLPKDARPINVEEALSIGPAPTRKRLVKRLE